MTLQAGFSQAPATPSGALDDKDSAMKNVRRIGVAVAAAALSFGLLGLSAPAHAKGRDISWDLAVTAPTAPVTLISSTAPTSSSGPVSLN